MAVRKKSYCRFPEWQALRWKPLACRTGLRERPEAGLGPGQSGGTMQIYAKFQSWDDPSELLRLAHRGLTLQPRCPMRPSQLASSLRGERCLGQAPLAVAVAPVSQSCQTDQLATSDRSPLRLLPRPVLPALLPVTSPTQGESGRVTNLGLASQLLPHLYNPEVLSSLGSVLLVGP